MLDHPEYLPQPPPEQLYQWRCVVAYTGRCAFKTAAHCSRRHTLVWQVIFHALVWN